MIRDLEPAPGSVLVSGVGEFAMGEFEQRSVRAFDALARLREAIVDWKRDPDPRAVREIRVAIADVRVALAYLAPQAPAEEAAVEDLKRGLEAALEDLDRST